ncbi:MAG: hypothetical protein PHO56_03660 [Patescibacteria group bacterium]|nr:hypothetical protein [Patescibacteria group bacterium]
MFELNDGIVRMLENGYEDMRKFCCDCALAVVKDFDRKLFRVTTLADQVCIAKTQAQLIECCSRYNEKRTEEDEHLSEESINSNILADHYFKTMAFSDFRRRWAVMVEEMWSDFNRISTREHFQVSEPEFIHLFLNYRLGRAIYTFGERHHDLFVCPEERERDRRLIAETLHQTDVALHQQATA